MNGVGTFVPTEGPRPPMGPPAPKPGAAGPAIIRPPGGPLVNGPPPLRPPGLNNGIRSYSPGVGGSGAGLGPPQALKAVPGGPLGPPNGPLGPPSGLSSRPLGPPNFAVGGGLSVNSNNGPYAGGGPTPSSTSFSLPPASSSSSQAPVGPPSLVNGNPGASHPSSRGSTPGSAFHPISRASPLHILPPQSGPSTPGQVRPLQTNGGPLVGPPAVANNGPLAGPPPPGINNLRPQGVPPPTSSTSSASMLQSMSQPNLSQLAAGQPPQRPGGGGGGPGLVSSPSLSSLPPHTSQQHQPPPPHPPLVNGGRGGVHPPPAAAATSAASSPLSPTAVAPDGMAAFSQRYPPASNHQQQPPFQPAGGGGGPTAYGSAGPLLGQQHQQQPLPTPPAAAAASTANSGGIPPSPGFYSAPGGQLLPPGPPAPTSSGPAPPLFNPAVTGSNSGPPQFAAPSMGPTSALTRPRYPVGQLPPPAAAAFPSPGGGFSGGMMPPPPTAGGNSNAMPPPPMVGNGPVGPPNGPPPSLNGPRMPPMPPGGQQPVAGSRFGQDMSNISSQLGGLSVTQQGFQKMWGQESLDLLQNRHVLPPDEIVPPRPKLQAENWNSINCSPDIFRCTLSKIPETETLLKKARLPLGVLIHPFKDLSHLPVIQCSTIVRCRSCRTYINPFVHFVDQRRWRCNLCYRVNELPEEFLYDPVSKSYGDPSRRPECRNSTIEFIAPQEYMLRPPQPAVYLFLLDVSRQALECGYLRSFCDILIDELDKLPGDSRTQVGLITYHRTLQFYMLPEGASQASQLVVGDVEDVFLPTPCDLLINLQACKEQLVQMLTDLPELFNGSQETDSCLGSALQAAYKMISPTGGRITVVQATLPNIGPGALKSREGTQGKDTADSGLLGPTTDFYKKLSLDCSGQQIAVDCFVLNNQHVDLATISGISKFSGGQIQTFPGYHNLQNQPVAEKFERAVRRYLTRKIGFEAVMRIRCTRGMSLHTFHGHFFVRSTDLLSLPNVNPDAGFGMQVSIDEDLKDSREVSFQAALLYTSSRGERRIRVHTLCIPTTSSLQEIIQGCDQQCIVGLLAKMAVDRSLNSSLVDAREAFINVCVDTITRWKMIQCISQTTVLPMSSSLRLLPLYILALLKSPAFTARSGVRLDNRTSCLIDMKCLPLQTLLQSVYPDLYRVDQLELAKTQEDEEGVAIPAPDRLQLSAEHVVLSGAYLMDLGDLYYLYVGKVVPTFFCEKIFGVTRVTDIDENITDLPELDNEDSERLRTFVQFLNNRKSHPAPVRVVRDDSKNRFHFIQMLVDDRSEASFSYYEFLQHLKTQIK